MKTTAREKLAREKEQTLLLLKQIEDDFAKGKEKPDWQKELEAMGTDEEFAAQLGFDDQGNTV